MIYRLQKAVFVVVALIIALSVASVMTGCASPESYGRYLAAQSAAIKSQKPMLRITAQAGQPITGLSSIEVYGPGMAIQQERPSEWAAVATSGLNMIGVVGGIAAMGQASRQLVDSVGAVAGSGPVTTTTTTDNRTWTTDRHDIANSFNPIDNTAPPTIVKPVVVNPVVVQPVVISP